MTTEITTQNTKEQIRKKILFQLTEKKIPLRKQRENKVKEKIMNHSFFIQSKRIGFYSAIQHEINLNFLFDFAHQKNIYLPYFDGNSYSWQPVKNQKDLTKGKYNILQPAKKTKEIFNPKDKKKDKKKYEKIELFFIPAVAFHMKKYWRIGRGGGYYDRLLQGENGLKVGIGFKEQGYLEHHKVDSWDIAMDEIWLG